MQNKRCPKCKKRKPLSSFYKSKSIKSGFRCWCKLCSRKADKKYVKNPIKNRVTNRKSVLKIRFGLSLADYDYMLEKQNGVCAICGKLETKKSHYNDAIVRLSVDHNHKTGKVRGLLCRRCNVVLGQTEENIEILLDMVKYLKRTE